MSADHAATFCESNEARLFRLHPRGRFVETFSVPMESQGESLNLRGEPDGNITVEGALTHRRQTLRFDDVTFAFVVEGPTIPRIELDANGCDGPSG